MKHTLKTYVYSHYNMCNIPIYFYNIKMKHLQHPNETPETLKGFVRFAEKTSQNTVSVDLLGEKNIVPAEKTS